MAHKRGRPERIVGERWKGSKNGIDVWYRKDPDGKIRVDGRITPYIDESKKNNKYKTPDKIMIRTRASKEKPGGLSLGNNTLRGGQNIYLAPKNGEKVIKTKDNSFNPEIHVMVKVSAPGGRNTWIQKLKVNL